MLVVLALACLELAGDVAQGRSVDAILSVCLLMAPMPEVVRPNMIKT